MCFPAGDTAQGLAQGTQYWAFRGRRVVAALADQLVAQQGLGNATDVLVAGDSAGGVSALNNADFMLQRVRDALPRCEDVGDF
jgi:Pectinacetylesterase